MKSLSSRAVIYGLVILFGLLCALPNLLPASTAQKLPTWYTDNTLALGLDLRGGSHLLLEVDTRELLRNDNQQLASDLAVALRKERIAFTQPVISAEAVQLAARQADDNASLRRTAESLNTRNDNGLQRFNLKQDQGRITLTMTDAHRQALTSDAVDRSLEVVRRRLDETGLVEPSITRQGSDGILVQMPGVANPQEIRQLLGTTAKMTFHWAADGKSRRVFTLPDESQSNSYNLEEQVAMEGKHIRDAQLAFNPDSGQPVVNFKLDREGTSLFGEMTRTNIGRPLAIVLDQKVITAPVIRGVIGGGSGEISGSFTAREASNLALLLRAGALPAPLKVIEERTVGPDLGSDAIAMGVSTGLLGALLVVGFMLAVYGRWGFIACVGLTINVGLIFGILSLLGATLTLPGIAGIILSIGMAVDANILINERIREETRAGKSAFSAMSEGFGRAYGTILDSNVTTLIAVSMLFLFGNGPVKGFAVTIGIGLLTSMFTAIAVTRLLMEWRVRRMGRKPLNISGIRILDRLTSGSLNLMR
ncbi:MAG: protein translocase subunit SecD, partial [Pseudoalteromonas distincta]